MKTYEHGTYLCAKKTGCARPECRAELRRERKRAGYRLATRGPAYVDATPAREHVLALMAGGMTYGQIEHHSGVNRTSVRRLLGEVAGQPAAKGLRPETAAALLRLSAPRFDVPATGHGLIPSHGTMRRLQALRAIGWPQAYLMQRLGRACRTVQVGRGDLVLAATAAAVVDLYNELSMRQGPSNRARLHAERQGWAPPLAWDDDTIDDPGAQPVEWRTCTRDGCTNPPNAARGLCWTHYGRQSPARRSVDLDEWMWLVGSGENAARAAERIGVSLSGIEKAATRHDRNDVLALIGRARGLERAA